jgi:DNA mismatch repair protein MutS2
MAALSAVLEPKTLLEIQRTLTSMRRTRRSLHGMAEELPRLWQRAQEMVELRPVEKEITRCLSQNGEVLDQASPNLANVRHRLRESRLHLYARLESIMKSARGQKIIQEAVVTEREGRYVIPVKIEFRREIKGITHDVSNTGATVFVEPWTTVELGNEVRELANEEKREVERILRKLSLEVGVREAEIAHSVSCLAELDVALAKARYARAVKASVPTLLDFADKKEPAVIRLVEARHPLLGSNAVPLSVEIGRDFFGLVITGPNTGGKTVALKTVGLLSLMAQAGIPIPASPESSLPVFDDIFADIGDEQSIEQTLSSFSWHMGNVRRILTNATSRSLVLLDELGTSTDPAEGSALARAVLLHFLEQGVLTVATTHYGELKAFAHATPGLQNASFEFNPLTLMPTYRLTVGIPGGSNALATAAHLGILPSIIDRARSFLSSGAVELEAVLADVMAEKQKTESVRSQMEKERAEVEQRNAELKERLERLSLEEARAIQEARDRVVREAADLHRQIQQAAQELRREKSRERIEQAKKAMAGVRKELNTPAWKTGTEEPGAEPIQAGDRVQVSDLGLQATVLSVSKETGEAEVQSGKLVFRLGPGSLRKVAGGEPAAASPGRVTRPPARVITPELDLRGKHAEEVEVPLDMYLNDAALANLHEVRIIHGIGTGTVRQIVRDTLAAHPLVKSFRTANQNEGGGGATVVSL